MNDHTDIQKRLSAYCGNDLPPQECTLVEEHLKGCPECRFELAELQITMKLLRTIPEVEPPPWMTARIMVHIHEQQEQRSSWLKRLFVPLHIKLPLEGLALLFVCVTGFYLSQRVGSELQRDVPQMQEEMSANPATAPKLQVPDIKSAVTTPLPTLTKEIPAASLQKTADPHIPAPASQAPAAMPTLAPAPSAGEDYSAPAAAKSRSNVIEPYKSAPKAESSDSVAGAPAGALLPQLTIRMSMAYPSPAPALIRETLIRSGGTIINEPSSPAGRLKAHIAVARLGELYEQLEKIGKIVERPRSANRAGIAEITIYW